MGTSHPHIPGEPRQLLRRSVVIVNRQLENSSIFANVRDDGDLENGNMPFRSKPMDGATAALKEKLKRLGHT